MAIVYIAVALAVLIGFTSFAVDYGRVQTAKTELEQVAAGAARAGAIGYVTSVASAKTNAVAVGNASLADGQAVTIDSTNDIAFGNWNTSTQTFATLTGGAQGTGNAVQVSCSRTSAKNNQIPTLLAAGMGRGGCNITAAATALCVQGYALFGNSSVSLAGSAYTDSFNAALFSYSTGNANPFGSVGSNGSITLAGTSTIKGDARYGSASSVTVASGCSVTGTQASESSSPALPTVTIPGSAMAIGYYSFSSGVQYCPAGSYNATGFSLSGTTQLICLGPVTVYSSGDINISGSASITAYNNLPANFSVLISGNHNITCSTTGPVYCDVYNPQGTCTYTGAGEVYGRCTANTISLTGAGTCGFHYDESLGRTNNGGCNTGGCLVHVVK